MDPTVEKRQHPRQQVSGAVMITPNGDRHNAQVLDLSLGGARMGLPADWVPSDGTALRIFFLFDTDSPIMLEGRVIRVAIDHLGLEFAPDQEERIRDLLDLLR